MVQLVNNRWAPRLTTRGKMDKIRAYVHRVTREQGEQAAVRLVRQLCHEDLFYLCYEILGYRDLVEPLHDDLCDFIEWCEREQVTNLVLIPRGHFKSTIATVGRCIQWMIRDHNTAIGLGSADLKSSRKFLREIRQQVETNTILKKLFPDVFFQDPKRESAKWTEDEIQVRRDKVKKEGTVKVFGLEDGLPTGDHYDHMIIDDAVNEDNVRTEDRLAKVDQQSRYLTPLMVRPDQPINWVGTRYHVYDLYQTLLKAPKTALYHRQAVEGGKAIFPERFTMETLEDTRIKLGSYIFSCQYMMEPVDAADKRFKREWIQWYTREVSEKQGFAFFLTVDPASRRRKSSDFTAMLVYAVDADWNMYLVDGVHDKLNPAQRIDAVFRLCRKWGITVVGYETIGFQETDKFYIERRQADEAFYFQIIEITAHATRKDERIMGLQPIMQAGKFHLPKAPIPYTRLWESPDDGLGKTVDIVEQLLMEFDFFPSSAHDDLLDASQMAREVVYAGHIVVGGNSFPSRGDYKVEDMYIEPEEESSPWVI